MPFSGRDLRALQGGLVLAALVCASGGLGKLTPLCWLTVLGLPVFSTEGVSAVPSLANETAGEGGRHKPFFTNHACSPMFPPCTQHWAPVDPPTHNLQEEGGRHTPFFTNYKPQFFFRTADVTGACWGHSWKEAFRWENGTFQRV